MSNKPQWLTVVTVKDGALSAYERFYWLDKLINERTSKFDSDYGSGNWMIALTTELPQIFATDLRAACQTYTIVGGELVCK